MWSQPAARDDRMVVSEIGEQWSPKQPPPITAAIAAYTTVPISPPVRLNARGKQIGSMIAYVPQDEPVRKEISAQRMKVMVRSQNGVIHDSVILIRYAGAPSHLVMELMQYAIARIRIAAITALIPRTAVSIISFTLAFFVIHITTN